MSQARAAVLAALVCVAPASARAERTWTEEKCARYARDWDETIRRFGTQGASAAFLERHAAFLSGGCAGPRDVCPRTAKDLDLANVLTIRAMNFGAASTFLPFSCRDGKKHE
jgi:hypothetical protein